MFRLMIASWDFDTNRPEPAVDRYYGSMDECLDRIGGYSWAVYRRTAEGGWLLFYQSIAGWK